jgi:regulator of replication initiation timing
MKDNTDQNELNLDGFKSLWHAKLEHTSELIANNNNQVFADLLSKELEDYKHLFNIQIQENKKLATENEKLKNIIKEYELVCQKFKKLLQNTDLDKRK